MILKKIYLENIRSYEKTEIEFPKGSVLLSGDIGSGKTSILMAIEFALFGLQPGQRGSSLLKNGKDEAKVILEFEIEDSYIIIERTLKRGKTITQNYCSISINNEKKEISVTELKSQILSLLNYPSEFAKKQNLLYKFTVYTPQEEMKQIILQDSETRINTLRHVFGIDKYKKIIENSSFILSKIREEKRIKQALMANSEKDKESLLLKEEELQTKRYNLVSAEKDLFDKQEIRKKLEEEKEKISEKIAEKNKLQQEIEKTKLMISNKNDSISNNKKTIESLELQIKELESLQFEDSKIEKLNSEINSEKQKKDNLNQRTIEISSEINALKFKNNDNSQIKEKLTYIEVCPTCLQDVNQNYKSNVINKLDNNISENNTKISELEKEKLSILDFIKKIDVLIIEKEKEISELNKIKIRLESLEEKRKYIEELNKNNHSLNNDLEMLNKHLISLKNSVLEMQKYDNLYTEKTNEFNKSVNEEKAAEIRVVELKKEIEFFIQQIEELNKKIEKAKEIEFQVNYLSELEHWITKKFIPLIYSVEKNVMTKLKIEFTKLFEKWFCMLVSDSFNIRLQDDFTPIIEQQDYEIDYAYLSGGERTAVALAYRLALNQVINSLLSKIKTRNVVILDEPTDGFSDAQLDKMRDIFQQLDVKQLLIVSHEQKIEDYVENVIKLKKNSGISETTKIQ